LLENSSNQRVEFKIFKILGELTIEERTLVSASYKNIVGNKRAELRVLTAIE
jgi:14-3-3 protein epsilon